jgi:hypothetical protein
VRVRRRAALVDEHAAARMHVELSIARQLVARPHADGEDHDVCALERPVLELESRHGS